MWKIYAGLCVRRPVVLTPELTTFKRCVKDFFMDLEIQKSCLSVHEVRHKTDLERMLQSTKNQQEGKSVEKPDNAVSLLTAKDLELDWEANEKEFWKLAETACYSKPECSNKTTAWRQLNRNLFLLIRQRLGQSCDWGLPVVEVNGEETLRSAADNLAKSLLPPEAMVTIVGNAPVGVHKYFYRTDGGAKQGVQMYFLNAYVDKLWRGENVAVGDKSGDFAWSTRDELSTYIQDKAYHRRVRTFIIDY